jgi:Ca2+/H+ antiporter, TMEM165/GDT1 family
LSAFVLGFVVVFLAELGDKSQLMAVALATRYRATTVLVAITAATTAVHVFSVAIGGVLGASLPTRWIQVASGLAFLAFGAWTLVPDTVSENDHGKAVRSGGLVLLSVFGAFFLAELGDKTMVATVLLAVDHDWVGIWLGSTLGMVVADALAIGVGLVLGRTLPAAVLRTGAAVVFFLGGGALLFDALRG